MTALAVIAERSAMAQSAAGVRPAGRSVGFYTGDDEYLYCDHMRIDDIRSKVRPPRLPPDAVMWESLLCVAPGC